MANTLKIAMSVVFCALASSIDAADAGTRLTPASLAGRVYHEHTSAFGYGSSISIAFEDEARFTFLWQLSNQDRALGFTNVTAPDPNGTYSFEPIDETRGTLLLRYSDGTRAQRDLTFDTPTDGKPGVGVDASFFLTDLAAWRMSAGQNISARFRAEQGRSFVFGFVVPPRQKPKRSNQWFEGDYAQPVLVRVIGPSLLQFGIISPWEDPKFILYRNGVRYQPPAMYDDWTVPFITLGGVGKPGNPLSGFTKLFSYVGAFALSAGSKDSVALIQLPEGAYTIVCEPADVGGEALVEVYFLP